MGLCICIRCVQHRLRVCFCRNNPKYRIPVCEVYCPIFLVGKYVIIRICNQKSMECDCDPFFSISELHASKANRFVGFVPFSSFWTLQRHNTFWESPSAVVVTRDTITTEWIHEFEPCIGTVKRQRMVLLDQKYCCSHRRSAGSLRLSESLSQQIVTHHQICYVASSTV